MTNQLFPKCEVNAESIAAKQQRLAELEADLAEYRAHKGEPGYYFGRGFVSSTKAAMSRIRQWLREVQG